MLPGAKKHSPNIPSKLPGIEAGFFSFFGFCNQDMVLVGFLGMVRVHLGDVLYGNVKFLTLPYISFSIILLKFLTLPLIVSGSLRVVPTSSDFICKK